MKHPPKSFYTAMTVHKNVPMPERNSNIPGWRLVLNRMAPGDCVFLDSSSVMRGMLRAAANLKIKCTSRKMEKGGWGVWRV